MLALDDPRSARRRRRSSALAPDWGPEAIASVARQVEAGIDGPRYAHELYKLSQLLDVLGQPEQALKRVEEGLKLSGGDLDGLCLAGRYAGKLGRTQAAADFFQKALARSPRAPVPRRDWAACCSTRASHRTRSSTWPRRYGRHRTPRPSSTDSGPAHARLGHFAEAVSLFRRAVRLAPDEAAIHRNLGQAEEGCGNLPEAVTHYRAALRLDPDDASAIAGLKRLAGRPAAAPTD